MATLGQELKRKREESGVTLRHISDSTHIGMRFLEALEADDLKVLPGGIFTRAFVRKFAKHVGLEEATAISLYEELLAATGGEADRRFVMGVENWDTPQRSNSALWLSLVVLAVLAAAAYLAYSYFSTPKESETAEAPAVLAPVATVTPAPTPTPEPSPTATPAPDKLVLVAAAGTSECWMKITRDAEASEEVTLRAGETREFVATDKLILSVGRLTAVTLTLNGRELDPSTLASTPGGVVAKSVVLTRENYQRFSR